MLPLLVYGALVFGAGIVVIVLSTLLGKPRHSPHKDVPYESGIAPVGEAHIRQSVPYYLVAVFFILFDVDIIFLYPWAVRAYELSWGGFIKALVFILFLFAGLVYIWLRGGLIWRHLSTRKPTPQPTTKRS